MFVCAEKGFLVLNITEVICLQIETKTKRFLLHALLSYTSLKTDKMFAIYQQ